MLRLPRGARSGWVGALAAIVLALAPTTARAGTVLLLRSGDLPAYRAVSEGFRAAFGESVVEWSVEEGGTGLEARVETLKPDVVVTIGLRASLFARDHLPRVPRVVCAVQHPERHGLSGAWVTAVLGTVPPAVDLAALREAAPDVKRVAVFAGPGADPQWRRAARAAARAAAIELHEVEVHELNEFAALARAAAARADALWLPSDPSAATPETFRFLLRLSIERKIPLLTFSESLVKAGALTAVEPDYHAVGAGAVAAVRRVRAGERAGDVPPISISRTRSFVNSATARAIGRPVSSATPRPREGAP